MKGEQNKGNIENINNIFKLAPLLPGGAGGGLFGYMAQEWGEGGGEWVNWGE